MYFFGWSWSKLLYFWEKSSHFMKFCADAAYYSDNQCAKKNLTACRSLLKALCNLFGVYSSMRNLKILWIFCTNIDISISPFFSKNAGSSLFVSHVLLEIFPPPFLLILLLKWKKSSVPFPEALELFLLGCKCGLKIVRKNTH